MSHPTGPESRGQNLDAAFKAFGAVGILISVALIVGVLVLTDPFGELARQDLAGGVRESAVGGPTRRRRLRDLRAAASLTRRARRSAKNSDTELTTNAESAQRAASDRPISWTRSRTRSPTGRTSLRTLE